MTVWSLVLAFLVTMSTLGIAVARPGEEGMRSREEYVLFGPLGEESYRRYSPAAPNDPEYAIKKIRATFGRREDDSNAVPRADRLKMWANYQELMDQLERPSGQAGGGLDAAVEDGRNRDVDGGPPPARPALRARTGQPVLEQVYAFAKRVNPLAVEQMTEHPTGLGQHLAGIRAFCNALYCTPAGRSRFPQILTDRQALVIAELAAPLHDALKYLGSFKAQVMPDHEIITAELVRRTFAGHAFILRGQQSTVSAEDAALIASTIGDHENIEKEAGRTDRLRSADVRMRARALFFIADVLTGAIVEDPAGSGRFRFEQKELDGRFVDLYFRHIDLVKGKIFRPEWGLLAIRDLGTTLDTLVREHGLTLTGANGGTALQTMRAAGVAAIERALAADRERQAAGGGAPVFTAEQNQRIAACLKELQDR